MLDASIRMSPLTDRQEQAMRALGIAWLERDHAPASARTVSRRMPDKRDACAPISTANTALKALQAMGLVERHHNLSKDGAILWKPTPRGMKWLRGCVAPRLAAERLAKIKEAAE